MKTVKQVIGKYSKMLVTDCAFENITELQNQRIQQKSNLSTLLESISHLVIPRVRTRVTLFCSGSRYAANFLMILSPVKATHRSKFKTRCASSALFVSPVAFGATFPMYLFFYSLFLHTQHDMKEPKRHIVTPYAS